ncbi:MAG: electron transport complex subunit RsxC [Tissierellia bacterium]|nr:electron transport complex subunit RsxC [Tissierellia bacterium]
MINNLTFSGGTHIDDNKHYSENSPLEMQELPQIVHIPLLQGIGVECTPLVKKGDFVKTGQKIGESDASFSTCVHSSITGEVLEIKERYTAGGSKVKCVTIQRTEGEEEFVEFISNYQHGQPNPEILVEAAKEAGIIGMGGAGFPFGVKLNGAIDNNIDSVIANGAECEPYLTSDHRLMLDFPEEVTKGVALVVDALNADAGYIAIEDNKKNAIDAMDAVIADYERLTVASLITKYPQGDSTRIVDAVLNRKIPIGQRTGSVNAFISNVGTFKALHDAYYEGKPLYERIVSVTGPGIVEPKNIMARVGTTVSDLIKQCGGFQGDVNAIISGGPMSGNQVFDLDSPVTKNVTGLVVLTRENMDLREETPCIKCGRCIEVCPSKLNPAKLDAAISKEKFDLAKDLYVDECIQCGACSYVCPAKRHLAEHIKMGINVLRTKGK